MTDIEELLISQLESARASLFAATTALNTAQALLGARTPQEPPTATEPALVPRVTVEEFLSSEVPPGVAAEMAPEPSSPLRDAVFESMGQSVDEDDWHGIDLQTMGQ